MSAFVDIFDLAAAALASAISASIPIRNIASVTSKSRKLTKLKQRSATCVFDISTVPVADKKQENAATTKNISPSHVAEIPALPALDKVQDQCSNIESREKTDGTLVTDADGAAQQVIVDALRIISKDVRIIGEESQEEERSNASDDLIQNKNHKNNHQLGCTYEKIFNCAKEEIKRRRTIMDTDCNRRKIDYTQNEKIQCSRVSVYIDPLDGTKHFAKGCYDVVTTLVAIVVDNTPVFGVICKPFGQGGGLSIQKSGIHNSGCFTCYGGSLLQGAFIAGGDGWEIFEQQTTFTLEEFKVLEYERFSRTILPRAVISQSRAGGVVGKCLDALHVDGVLEKDPVLVDGAGEKSLRLILGRQNEALWFFPKPGTSLWDVAALDAILISIGGKLTDKNGNRLDYTKKCRLKSNNNDGIIAASDAQIHETCIRIYKNSSWDGEE